MLMRNSNFPHLSYQVISDVSQIIDSHLKNEWVIRIEYTDEDRYLENSWRQWGKPFYKIKESTGVIGGIFACHNNHKTCSVRLHAEKISPVCHMYFPICYSVNTSGDLC